MDKKLFGNLPDGSEASLYTISNTKGMSAVVTDFGAILVKLIVPFADGGAEDVVMGYDKLDEYMENGCFFGATIAPNGNRIAKAKALIDGSEYSLEVNDGPNNLHSHYSRGGHKRLWSVADVADNKITFKITIPDGDIGFPGNIDLAVTYEVTEDNSLKLYYEGDSDKNTILNPTNHSYFNLSGHGSGSITDHLLKLKASGFTEVGAGSIPTGNIAPVKGTIFDFTDYRRIGDDIDSDDPQNVITGGYDHNFAIDDYKEGVVQEIAWVRDSKTGRQMSVATDLPGVQFYAGNYITSQTGKEGASYEKRGALCLETQYFPDAVNHPAFVSPVHGPGKPYKSTTIYKFV